MDQKLLFRNAFRAFETRNTEIALRQSTRLIRYDSIQLRHQFQIVGTLDQDAHL